MPASTIHPLGQQVFGEHELGDGKGYTSYHASDVLQITYTLIAPGRASVAVSYTIQRASAAAVQIFYVISPAQRTWSINGITALPHPHGIQYEPAGAIGVDQSGITIIQGTESISWHYDKLLDGQMAQLMALYDPGNPVVTIVYPDKMGNWVQKQAMWQPPNLGTRATIEHQGVELHFTHITPN